MKRRLVSWTIAVCASFLAILPVVAQDPPGPYPTPTPLPNPPYAIITYPAVDSTTQAVSVVSPCLDGIFALVGLKPDQIVQVTVQYPTSQSLQIVNLAALDGGMVLPPTIGPGNLPPTATAATDIPLTTLSLAISVDGKLSFTFVATHDPGKNQISLRSGSQEFGLQFWVFDLENPETNPPAITPTTPNPSY